MPNGLSCSICGTLDAPRQRVGCKPTARMLAGIQRWNLATFCDCLSYQGSARTQEFCSTDVSQSLRFLAPPRFPCRPRVLLFPIRRKPTTPLTAPFDPNILRQRLRLPAANGVHPVVCKTGPTAKSSRYYLSSSRALKISDSPSVKRNPRSRHSASIGVLARSTSPEISRIPILFA